MKKEGVKTNGSKPWMLILFLVAVAFLTFVLQQCLAFLLMSPHGRQHYIWVSLVSEALSYPFWMICVVWLASRSGRTTKSTWMVAIVMFLLCPSMQELSMHDLSRSFSTFFKFGFASDSWGRQFASKLPVYCLGLLMSWMDQILVRLFSYIGMAFAFRATTLHLRQVDAPPSPHRLTMRSLLWLTTLAAIWLSSGAFFNTIYSMAGLVVEQQGSNPRIVCLHILNEMATAMLWFSIAWIYVARNSRRWIGGLGVLTYAAFLVLDYFIPMFGVYPVGIDTTYRMGLLAISILNVGIAFLCVGMMHIAGYRWDFYGSDYRTTSLDPA